MILQLLCFAASAYVGVLFANIILSYVVMLGKLANDHVASRVWRMTSRVVDPVLASIRRFVQPVRLGATMLDLSPLIVIVGLRLLQSFVLCV